jgi:hypothetical protein
MLLQAKRNEGTRFPPHSEWLRVHGSPFPRDACHPAGSRSRCEDRLAETLANEVIQASTDFDGTERAPMRLAEARITLGVVAARQGDLEQAVDLGGRALSAPRKSLPSLLMVSRDLTRVQDS